MKISRRFSITALLLILTSCGGQGKESRHALNGKFKDQLSPIPLSIDVDATISGQYLAVLKGVNENITGKLRGAFTFSREDDLLVNDMRFAGGAPKLIYAQHLRTGTRCPDLRDDSNGDGIIDLREGEASFGKILYPLDGDLNGQSSFDSVFPVSDDYGGYRYTRVASFKRFIADLRAPRGVFDEYSKLDEKAPLDLESKTVVILGVPAGTDLPGTVISSGRMNPHQSLPVACGEIHRVLAPPGEIED